jgi:hypothetical protein
MSYHSTIGLREQDKELAEYIKHYKEKHNFSSFAEAGRRLLELAVNFEKSKEEQEKNRERKK